MGLPGLLSETLHQKPNKQSSFGFFFFWFLMGKSGEIEGGAKGERNGKGRASSAVAAPGWRA